MRLGGRSGRAVAGGKDVFWLVGQHCPADASRRAGRHGGGHVGPNLVDRGMRLVRAGQADLHCIETIKGEGAVHLCYQV